jgi:enamine deaminase RidA (YjgF/YER057c/UK114 family)
MPLAKTFLRLGLMVALGFWLKAAAAGAADLKPAQAEIRCVEPDAQTGTSTAVVVGDAPLAHTAQLLPLNRFGALVGKGEITKQAEQVLTNLAEVLTAMKSGLEATVKLNVYLAQAEAMPAVQQVIAHQFRGPIKPAASFVVGGLPNPEVLVAMDAVAVSKVSSIFPGSSGLPSAYEQKGIEHCRLLFPGARFYVSGMADTNNLPEATRKTLEKLLAVVEHLGSKKKDIIQLKAFLQPMSEVATVRQQIVSFFEGSAPPVVFVEWISPAPNPPIEIELIAGGTGGGEFSKEVEAVSFLTPPGTTASKVFSRVAQVNHGKLIYVSGLYGMKTEAADGQVREIFASLGGVLKQTGGDFENLAKATYYFSDDAASDSLNKVRPEFYNPQRPPSASKVKVKGVGPPGKTVTFDIIGVSK